jgi:hypothetical protein
MIGIPAWVYWLALAGLGAALLGQQVRLGNAKRETMVLQLQYEKEQRGRADDLAKYREEKAAIAATHATNQQELTDAFNKKLRLAQDAVNERSALVGRLRAQLASYTTLDRTSGAPDAAVIQRAADRLQAVGTLLAEGVELAAEGAAVVQRRDAEVAALVEQVRVDRLACQAAR